MRARCWLVGRFDGGGWSSYVLASVFSLKYEARSLAESEALVEVQRVCREKGQNIYVKEWEVS